MYTSPGVGHALLSSQQLLFASLFAMLSPEQEMKGPPLLLNLELAPGIIVRHQCVRYLCCYTDASTVKPIIAGFALDHQTTVIGFLADTQDVSIFCL
jgi:hypothetical protein